MYERTIRAFGCFVSGKLYETAYVNPALVMIASNLPTSNVLSVARAGIVRERRDVTGEFGTPSPVMAVMKHVIHKGCG